MNNSHLKDGGLMTNDNTDLLADIKSALIKLSSQKEVRKLSTQELQDLKYVLNKMVQEALPNSRAKSIDDITNVCTGHYWRDEFGNEAFVHDEFIYCPVHDR